MKSVIYLHEMYNKITQIVRLIYFFFAKNSSNLIKNIE